MAVHEELTRRESSASGLLLSLIAGLLLSVVAGCNTEFDPPSLLNSLRILAIRAEPPEVRPGELVALDALVFRPGDGSAPLAESDGEQDQGTGDEPSDQLDPPPGVSYAWRVCYLAATKGMYDEAGAIDEGEPASCFDLPAMTVEELLGGEDVDGQAAPAQDDAALDLTARAVDLGEQPTAMLVIPPLPQFPAPPSPCGGGPEVGARELWLSGFQLMVSLRISDGQQTVEANKRLLIRPSPEQIEDAGTGKPFALPRSCSPELRGQLDDPCARNENPAPPELEAPNGEWPGTGPILVAPGDKVKLRPRPPAEEDQQLYVGMPACGMRELDDKVVAAGGEYVRQEARYHSWYVDGGELDLQATGLTEEEGDRDNAWSAPEELTSPQRYNLVLVSRDGRGGISWRRYPIEVRPH